MRQDHRYGRGLALALDLIAWLLHRRTPFAPRDLGAVLVGAGYGERHRRTVHRWLVALEGAGLIERIGVGRYRSTAAAKLPSVPRTGTADAALRHLPLSGRSTPR